MKNLNLLRFAAIFSLFIILFGSCSEDGLKKERANALNGPNSMNPSDIKTGTIQATASWENQVIYMIAYNDSYTSEPVYANDLGVIEMKEVPEGIYTVLFHVEFNGSAPREFDDIIINDVVVNPYEVTDLGVIEF